jgi:O-methyltransferase
VYDSFEGLPEPGESDTYLGRGELKASISDFESTFNRFGAPLPMVHPGWFSATLPEELPEVIGFAYLDGDFYASVLTSLRAVYPRMARGGVILIDDYADVAVNPRAWNGLPGVKLAVDAFLADKIERAEVLVGAGDLAFGLVRRALETEV